MYDYALGTGAWWLQAHNVGLVIGSLCYVTSLWFSWVEIEIEGAFAWQMSNTHTWRWQWDACGEGGICVACDGHAPACCAPGKSSGMYHVSPLKTYECVVPSGATLCACTSVR